MAKSQKDGLNIATSALQGIATVQSAIVDFFDVAGSKIGKFNAAFSAALEATEVIQGYRENGLKGAAVEVLGGAANIAASAVGTAIGFASGGPIGAVVGGAVSFGFGNALEDYLEDYFDDTPETNHDDTPDIMPRKCGF